MSDNMNAQKTVYITFRGGKAEFTHNLQTWIKSHNWHFGKMLGPDSRNIVSVEVAVTEVDAIYTTLQEKNGQPDGLYEAFIPFAAGGGLPRQVIGEEADAFDEERQQMALSDRKVAVTPRQMAKRGGWY